MMIWMMMTASACGLSSQIRYVTDPPASGEVLYSDDFSARGSWDTWSDDSSIVDYSTGGLRFFINQTGYDYWSIVDEYFLDTTIDVDVTKINGPDDNRFGVLCRYQDEKNYYQFMISSDGYYGIVKVLDGQPYLISSDQLRFTDVITQGTGGVNHLQAVCLGSSLTLSVNDVLLASAFDTDLDHGKVGLTAGSNAEKGVDILFTDFQVSQP